MKIKDIKLKQEGFEKLVEFLHSEKNIVTSGDVLNENSYLVVHDFKYPRDSNERFAILTIIKDKKYDIALTYAKQSGEEAFVKNTSHNAAVYFLKQNLQLHYYL